jgi:hypothetical protein
MPEIIVHDDEVEWIYESTSTSPGEQAAPANDRVLVPRRVIYAQGILLGAVAIISFALGMLVQSSHQDEAAVDAPRPRVLNGRVTYRHAGRQLPDEGSVVIAVPADRRPEPDRKAAFEGLRPGDPTPLADNPSLRTIRSLGGDVRRTDSDGNFQMQVANPGSYYVLVISSHVHRPAQDSFDKRHIAQLGRYVVAPLDLLADRQYLWQLITIRRNQTHDVEF